MVMVCVWLEDLFCVKSEYLKILNDYLIYVLVMNGLVFIVF